MKSSHRKVFDRARRHTLGVLAAVVAVLLVAPDALAQKKGAYQPTGPRPPVTVTPIENDFGTRDPNELIHVKFDFTNTSQSSLRIVNVQPSCHCTVPTLQKKTILPGETIEVSATLDLRGSISMVSKDFLVRFKGFETHPIRCIIKGNLAYLIGVEPQKPKLNGQGTGNLTLTARDKQPFRVLSVHGADPQILASSEKTEDGRAVEWVVRYDLSGSPTRPYMLLIETDHPKVPVLDIRLWGQMVTGPELTFIRNWRNIFCNRNIANLGQLAEGDSNEFGVAISRPVEQHSAPCRVSCQDDRVKIEVVAVDPVDGREKDETYTIKVTNVSDQEGMFIAPLYFECGNHPDSKEHRARMWIGGYFRPDAVAVGQR